MATVFTMKGAHGKKHHHHGKKRHHCRVVRMKNGCHIDLCPVPKSKKHPSGFSFKKGSMRCR